MEILITMITASRNNFLPKRQVNIAVKIEWVEEEWEEDVSKQLST